MKIVHLNTIDQGGSYKAAKRIHEALILSGADSTLLLRTKINPDNTGIELVNSIPKSLISKTKNLGNLLLSKGVIITDEFGTDVSRLSEVRKADVIILHWCNSFLGYRQYERIVALGKPVFLVAHDMWPSTGGCHLDAYCGGYEHQCNPCPVLKHGNLAYRNFVAKQKAFKWISYVGVSKWGLEIAKKSEIWSGHRMTYIHNPIDYDLFSKRLETKYDHIRDNTEQKIILCGAANTSNKNKSLTEFVEAINQLKPDNCRVVVFGENNCNIFDNCKYPVSYLGYIKSENDMAELYSFADVYVNTSRQESFCYTVGETLACETPVVAYGVGGIVDQIVHRENGYLAPCGDISELAAGIEYCLTHELHSIDLHNSLIETGQKYLRFIEGS